MLGCGQIREAAADKVQEVGLQVQAYCLKHGPRAKLPRRMWMPPAAPFIFIYSPSKAKLRPTLL